MKLTPSTTLGEYASNGDGTYDGRRVTQFLYYATTGKELSEAETDAIVAEAQERHRRKREQSATR